MMLERDDATAFEDNEFDPRFRTILSHRCETAARRCRNRGVDSRTPGTFRQIQQYAAIREIELSFAEAEEAVRAEPRQRSIGEGKLRARIDSRFAQLCPDGRYRLLKLGAVQRAVRAIAHCELPERHELRSSPLPW